MGQASIEHKLAESWCGRQAEWGDEGMSGRLPVAKHTSVGRAGGASMALVTSECSTCDSRVDESGSDSLVADGWSSMVFREGACPSWQIKQASIEHKLAES